MVSGVTSVPFFFFPNPDNELIIENKWPVVDDETDTSVESSSSWTHVKLGSNVADSFFISIILSNVMLCYS